jgi:hypothetical protein
MENNASSYFQSLTGFPIISNNPTGHISGPEGIEIRVQLEL